jgi:predicted dehydrogenase
MAQTPIRIAVVGAGEWSAKYHIPSIFSLSMN